MNTHKNQNLSFVYTLLETYCHLCWQWWTRLKAQTIPLSSPLSSPPWMDNGSFTLACLHASWLAYGKKTFSPCGNFPAEMIIRRGREGRGTDTGYNGQQRPYLHLISPPQTNQQKHGTYYFGSGAHALKQQSRSWYKILTCFQCCNSYYSEFTWEGEYQNTMFILTNSCRSVSQNTLQYKIINCTRM